MLANEQNISQNRMAIYSSVKRTAINDLGELMRILMESIDDALFDLSEKAETDRERNLYFEAMREIRIKRSPIQIRFNQEIKSKFSELSVSSDDYLNQLNHEDDDTELTLIELDDMEDNIAIENMISKARPQFEDDIFALLERLKTLLNRSDIDEDINPLDPKLICNCFHVAAKVLDTDIQVKLIFYKLFDKYVMANLGQFYRNINDQMIQKGVLPDFKASAERLKWTTRFMSNRTRETTTAVNPFSSDQTSNEQVLSSISSKPIANPVANTDNGILNLLQRALQQNTTQYSTGTLVNPGGAEISGANASGIHQSGNLNAAAPPVSAQSLNSNLGYITALNDLQTANATSRPDQTIAPGEFKRQIQQQLGQFNQTYRHQASAADKQIIDVVAMLFDFFLDDESLPDPVKILIGRLQIPILKVAIIDRDFFSHKKHPARRLLDSISKASLGWDKDLAKEKVLIDKIDSIVDFILTNFDNDIEVFDTALDDFKSFLKDESEEIKQANAELLQQERDRERQLNECHDAITEFLGKVRKNRDLSDEVNDFLDSVWRSVLFQAYLSLGKEDIQWRNLRRVTSALIWTLIPKHSEAERLKILQTLPSLLRALSNGMRLVKVSQEQQNRIFKMLAHEHAGAVKQTSRNIVTRVDDLTVWPDEETLAKAFANTTRDNSPAIDINLNQDSEKATLPVETVTDEAGEETDLTGELGMLETAEVINDLDDFTQYIKNGEIEIDEEIVIDSVEQTVFHQSPISTAENDDFIKISKEIEVGAWVEFTESDGQKVNNRLSWQSKVTGKLVFSNRQGAKTRSMSANAFAIELRSERARVIDSVSVFDRAINTIMSGIKN